MRTDLKTGMFIGTCAAVCVLVALSLCPSQTVEKRRRTIQLTGAESALPQSPAATETTLPYDDVKLPPAAMNQNTSAEPITPEEKPKEMRRFHAVAEGETLSVIAIQYYGRSAAWKKILDANSDIITNPDRIRPGTMLLIPDN